MNHQPDEHAMLPFFCPMDYEREAQRNDAQACAWFWRGYALLLTVAGIALAINLW